LNPFAPEVTMPIALPIPRTLFARLDYPWVVHITQATNLLGRDGKPGIVVRQTSRTTDEWTQCDINLTGSSGFGNHGTRLLRDYSVVDFEFKLAGRGAYTYFFAGDPSGWGLFKNLGVSGEAGLRSRGLAVIRIATTDLLSRYSGPLFFRLDDQALVIRGSYAGPARVKGIPIA
jgi:hypothetical protein